MARRAKKKGGSRCGKGMRRKRVRMPMRKVRGGSKVGNWLKKTWHKEFKNPLNNLYNKHKGTVGKILDGGVTKGLSKLASRV